MGGSGAALLIGRRIVAKDRRAPLGTGHILGQGQVCAAQTEEAAQGGSRDGFEDLAPRGRSRQGFGQLIKAR